MPPTPSTCITCGKPFAANRELATIPDASKIAFDPTSNRVWRICASCEEWNLLGQEASAVALPELGARYSATRSHNAGEPALLPIRIGPRLELLRVSREDLLQQGESFAAVLRAEVDRRNKMMKWAMGLGVVVVLGWLGFVGWMSEGDVEVPLLLILTYSEVELLQRIAGRLRGRPFKRGPFLINLGILVGGAVAVAAVMGIEHLRYNAIGFLVMMPLALIADRLFYSKVTVARITLANGSSVAVTQDGAKQLSFSWREGGTDLRIHGFPNGVTVSGEAVAPVFKKVQGWAIDPAKVGALPRMTRINESAYALLRDVGGLNGLLCALEGFRRESDGRVPMTELPILYLVALDLALSAESADSDDHDRLRDRALAAAEVAEVAEGLDEEGRPRP